MGCSLHTKEWSTWAGGLFVLLSMAILILMGRMVYHRHNIFGFLFAFLHLCFLTSVLKAVFLFSVSCRGTMLPHTGIFITYVFPLFLQMCTYSLLCFFFTFVLNKPTWSRIVNRHAALWASLNGTILVTLFAILSTCDDDDNCFESSSWNALYGVAYLILSLALCPLGIRVASRLSRGQQAVAPELMCRSSTQVLVSTVAIAIIFFTRAVYDLAVAAGYERWTVLAVERRHTAVNFVLVMVWDFVPTMTVLLLFRRIPSTPNANEFNNNIPSRRARRRRAMRREQGPRSANGGGGMDSGLYPSYGTNGLRISRADSISSLGSSLSQDLSPGFRPAMVTNSPSSPFASAVGWSSPKDSLMFPSVLGREAEAERGEREGEIDRLGD